MQRIPSVLEACIVCSDRLLYTCLEDFLEQLAHLPCFYATIITGAHGINVTIRSFISMQDLQLSQEIKGLLGNNNLPFAWHCSVSVTNLFAPLFLLPLPRITSQ